MAQTYDAIPDTTSMTDSRQKLLDRDEAVRSNFSGSASPANPVAGQVFYDTDDSRMYVCTTGGGSPVWRELTKEAIILAASDELTTITTGNGKMTFRMPYAFVVTAVRASLTTVSSSGLVTIDINEAGATILSTKLSIDASEKTSTSAATPAVISDPNLADDAEITIDFDAAGTGAKGVKVYLIGYRVS